MLEKNVELMGLHLIIFCLDSFIFKKLGSFCIGGRLIFFFYHKISAVGKKKYQFSKGGLLTNILKT